MSRSSKNLNALKDLFVPFFQGKSPSPRSIIHKFASSKVSFKEKFYKQLPSDVSLAKEIKNLLNVF